MGSAESAGYGLSRRDVAEWHNRIRNGLLGAAASVTTANITVQSGGSTQTFNVGTLTRPTPSFFGVVSDTSITSVRVGIPAGQVGLILDNVTVGAAVQGDTPVPIPEPNAAILLVSGFACLAGLRLRKVLP
jgi:hypothetical protein